jgi:hypothetical protein
MNQHENESASATQRASAVKQAYQAELLSKANVVGVGVGFRTVGGRRTDDIALVVMVTQKVPRAQLAPQDVLPREIEGVPVDVQEVGRISAQSSRAG